MRSPIPQVASVLLPIVYTLCLPFFVTDKIGVIQQDSCAYEVYRSVPVSIQSIGHAERRESISGYISSPAAPGPFAMAFAPAFATMWSDPSNSSPVSQFFLLCFFVFWTLFLATPFLASPRLHIMFVEVFAVSILAHFASVVYFQRRRGIRETGAEVLWLVGAVASVGILFTAQDYWLETIAISCVVFVSPAIRLARMYSLTHFQTGLAL